MNALKQSLINKAQEKYKKIYPASRLRSLDECFTEEEDELILWFNTEDGSTRVLRAQIKGKE